MSHRPNDPGATQTLDAVPLKSVDVSLSGLAAPGASPRHLMPETLSYAETLAAAAALPAPLPPSNPGARTAVLPRLQVTGAGAAPSWKAPDGARFEEKSVLGKGAMGEVALTHDRDIDRMVAVKRLLPTQNNAAAVARFVEEIRTVGQLEHPNIVPIHDVGVDDRGNYFFMMKHVQGDTLQAIVEKLQQGDAATHERFTFAVRAQVFLSVLQAVRYAHSHGIIHRDLKPANIMVGPYGEVMVMDWGLAKRLKGTPAQKVTDALASAMGGPSGGEGGSLYQTRHGTLLGTPAYMAPEQARSDVESVDARSDLYALCVLFHEFLTLSHYLHDVKTLQEMLKGVQEKALPTTVPHKAQGFPPVELVYFTQRGSPKDPAQRFQTADEMIEALQAILRGDIHIQCQVTFFKRVFAEASKQADKRPFVFVLGTTMVAALILMNIVYTIGWMFP